MTEEQRDWISRTAARQQENQHRREEWEEQRRQILAAEERGRRQTALETFLKERARVFERTTGSLPSRDILESWQLQYVNERADEDQARRAAKEERAARDIFG